MNPEDREYIFYLEDILLSIQRIEEYISGMDYQQFTRDYKTSDAVIRNFQIIGEAVKNLPKEIKAKYPNLPWEEMYGLRNRISHEYFGIDFEIIWDISTTYLPENKKEIEQIIEMEKGSGK
jgi:uncharacterized protein with HEPN domain